MYDEINCKWCGKPFKRVYAPEKYCCDECRISARGLQNRNKSHRWYHKHKHELSEKQRWGLGSGYLGNHRQESFNREYKTVKNEFKRLKIKKV